MSNHCRCCLINKSIEKELKHRILFVCHGNICRSPMAEFVMKDLVRKSGLEAQFDIESGQMTRQDYQRFDLLIGMDDWNIRNMSRICGGDPEGKIYKLLDFTPRRGDVADPWYTGDFEATWRDVSEGCECLLASFSPKTK